MAKEISPEEKIKLLADRGKQDFWFFMRYILGSQPGFDKIEEVPHRMMCEAAQRWNKQKKILLFPRDTFKTTVLVVGYAIWRIINDPEIAILLTSARMSYSSQTLACIKDVFEGHATFRACYGNMVGSKKWTWKEIQVSARKGSKRAPTIMTGGADSEKVSFHFDLILFDDPHDQKNITTPEQLQKVIQYKRGLMPILDSETGQLQVTATRWHHQDVNNQILTEEAGDWDVYIKPAEWVDENGIQQYFYPNRLTPAFLEKRKKELRSYFFSCQYMNNPTDDENALFKNSYFKNFSEKDGYVYIMEKEKQIRFKRSDLVFFVSCDPAGRGNLTEQRRLDYTGIVVVGVDYKNRWFIFEAERKRGMQPSDIINRLIELHYQYKPEVMGIESITYQGQIRLGLLREFERRGIRQPVRDLEHHNRDKGQRIRGLEPLYRDGYVFHARGLFDLEMELLNWSPNSTIHDDLIDPEAYVKDMAYRPDAQEVEEVDRLNPCDTPGLMIAADIAWTKEGRRGSFSEFLEGFTVDEARTRDREDREIDELAATLQ